MRKFLVLLKKEIKELLTWQMVLPLVITMLLFSFVGKIVGEEAKKSEQVKPIAVIDNDNTASSDAVIQSLKNVKFEPKIYNDSIDESIKKAKENKISALVVIPKGFEVGIVSGASQQIESYTILKSFSMIGSRDALVLKSAIAAINEYASNQIILSGIKNVDPQNVKNPIKLVDHVIIGDKMAEASPEAVMNFVSSQTTFIPIILFIVIIFAAQMIATAIATEKENKTLETLLSTPVSRKAIVSAKMLGAGVVAALMAVVYMLGFRSYMDGLTGGSMSSAGNTVSSDAMHALGLSFGTGDYVLLGFSLFGAIIAALAIALILGAFAEDSKSVQGLITPLMMLVMIPYFFSLFLDVNTISPLMKYVIYAIPFSHPFLAGPNIFLGNYSAVVYGAIYEIIVFIIFVLIAAKIFESDKIMTLKLNWSKKKK